MKRGRHFVADAKTAHDGRPQRGRELDSSVRSQEGGHTKSGNPARYKTSAQSAAAVAFSGQASAQRVERSTAVIM
jgi:hypothetical protein